MQVLIGASTQVWTPDKSSCELIESWLLIFNYTNHFINFLLWFKLILLQVPTSIIAGVIEGAKVGANTWYDFFQIIWTLSHYNWPKERKFYVIWIFIGSYVIKSSMCSGENKIFTVLIVDLADFDAFAASWCKQLIWFFQTIWTLSY